MTLTLESRIIPLLPPRFHLDSSGVLSLDTGSTCLRAISDVIGARCIYGCTRYLSGRHRILQQWPSHHYSCRAFYWQFSCLYQLQP